MTRKNSDFCFTEIAIYNFIKNLEWFVINHVYVTLGVFLGFYETFSFSYMLRRAKHFRTIFIYFKRHFFLLRCNLKTKITQFINPDLIANSEKLNNTKSICAIEMYDMQRKTNKLKIKTWNIHAKHVLRSAITYFNASHKKNSWYTFVCRNSLIVRCTRCNFVRS